MTINNFIFDKTTFFYIKCCRRFAELIENRYFNHHSLILPTVNKGNTFTLDPYEIAFFLTQSKNNCVYKNLSVTLDTNDDLLPGHDAVYTLAHHFGFYGTKLGGCGLVKKPHQSWIENYDRKNHRVIIFQEISKIN